jgi:hypothetical protein
MNEFEDPDIWRLDSAPVLTCRWCAQDLEGAVDFCDNQCKKMMFISFRAHHSKRDDFDPLDHPE